MAWLSKSVWEWVDRSPVEASWKSVLKLLEVLGRLLKQERKEVEVEVEEEEERGRVRFLKSCCLVTGES